MSPATAPSSDRVRKIAILVASVDAAAARQIYLHLPTEMAKQVRALAAQLGPVSAAEKQALLAAFQQSVSSAAATADPSQSQSSSSPVERPPASDLPADHAKAQMPPQPSGTQPSGTQQHPGTQQSTGVKPQTADSTPATPAWTQLSTEALVRFVQVERVAVIAVVISRLTPPKAVEVLRQLPRPVIHAVLKRLSHLQDVDPDASAAIDEHLAERLVDYQHRIESEQQNTQRLKAVIAAAPLPLQMEWLQVLREPEGQADEHELREPSTSASECTSRGSVANLYKDPVFTTADSIDQFSETDVQKILAEHEASRLAADVIPSQSTPDQRGKEVDRTFLHMEFERILSMSHRDIAALLSNVDSQTVLLALAGATPDFMRRLGRMLDSSDAKALTQRLQSIGPLNLRDIDEAQRRIIDHAAAMFGIDFSVKRPAA